MPRGTAVRHETQGTMETALAGLGLEEEELPAPVATISRPRARGATQQTADGGTFHTTADFHPSYGRVKLHDFCATVGTAGFAPILSVLFYALSLSSSLRSIG